MRHLSLLAAFAFGLATPALAQTTPATPLPTADTTAAFSPVGAWTYSIDTPVGVFTGTFVFTETEGVLAGTTSSDAAAGSLPLAEVVRLGRAVSFAFDDGEYGRIAASLTFAPDGATFAGTQTAMGYVIPFSGARKADG